MLLHKSKYSSLVFDENASILHQRWTEKLDSPEACKQENLLALKYIEKYRPAKFLANVKSCFAFAPQNVQHWINENVYSKALADGIEKMAFVVRDEINSEICIEQVVAKDKERIVVPQYFEQEDEAEFWLTSS